MKITIIGTGMVGSSIAYGLLNICKEIYLMDIDKKKLYGEWVDLRHAGAFKNCMVKLGTYRIARVCDYVIICAGKPRKSGKDKMESLLKVNRKTVAKIMANLRKSKVKILLVTNPPFEIASRYKNLKPMGNKLDQVRQVIDNLTGSYIIDRKGYSNWGITAEVTNYIIEDSGDKL